MKNQFYYWIAPLVIVVLTILFVKSNGEYNKYIFEGDQTSYFESGNLLFRNLEAHPFRTFGYGFLLSLPQILGMQAPYAYWPIILNLLFFLGILWTTYKLENLLGKPLLLPIGLALLLSKGFIRGMSFALTETGFSFFILLSTYHLLKFLMKKKAYNLFFLFLTLGFAALFRPGLYLFTLLIVPICIGYLILVKQINIKTIFSTILGLFLTLGIQSFLMKKTFNTYRLTYIDDITWYRYGGALATTIHEKNCISNQCFREEQAKRDRIIDTLSYDEMSVLAKADRKDILLNKTNAFIKMMKVNISTNLLSGSVKVQENKLLHLWTVFNNLFLSIIPFLMYALFLIIPRWRKGIAIEMHLGLLFCISIIAYTIITSGVSAYQGDRFHIAFYPLSILLLTILFTSILKKKNA
jgi:hypothetical protein